MHGVIGLKNRHGRKRKQGPRHPSGDIIQQPTESPEMIAVRQPHRQQAPIEARLDQRAETPLGILCLIGAITHAEYNAARWYASRVARYRAVIDCPKDSPNSIAGCFEPKRATPDLDDAGERKTEYDEAYQALSTAGRKSILAVNAMAINGAPCPPAAFPALIRGLKRLNAQRELTNRRKSRLLGN